IDSATSCFSGGTSQPATETLNFALKQLGYETGLNDSVLKQVNDFFKPIRDEYLKDGTLSPKVLSTDTDALNYKVPGGMLSNLVAQLKAQNAMDKFDEVLLETPRVREDLGFPPLVTPMSQMVGVQATSNVLAGERYKNISMEVKAYCRGEYGQAPGKINADVMKKVLGDEKPIEGRFADTLKPIFEDTKKQLAGVAKNDEDVLSYILFPSVTDKYFAARKEKEEKKVRYTIAPIVK
ncbi:MAG: oxaloacetate decarboxylase subunit alpha, partial [Clostridia bacterium]